MASGNKQAALRALTRHDDLYRALGAKGFQFVTMVGDGGIVLDAGCPVVTPGNGRKS